MVLLILGSTFVCHLSGQVTGFLPSKCAFRFDNRHWPSVPPYSFSILDHEIHLGDASLGLCGGMTFAVRDLFEAKSPVPTDDKRPEPGSVLYNYIVADLARTFTVYNVRSFLAGIQMGDVTTDWQKGIGWQSAREEWPLIKADVDAGLLSPVGLVSGKEGRGIGYVTGWRHLADCHQVLAYGYTQDGDNVNLKIYDPNFPGDDQSIAFNLAQPDNGIKLSITGYAADTFRGFFREEYSFHNPGTPITFQFGNSTVVSSPGI